MILSKEFGGSTWESNPPGRFLIPLTGFEDRAAHQRPSCFRRGHDERLPAAHMIGEGLVYTVRRGIFASGSMTPARGGVVVAMDPMGWGSVDALHLVPRTDRAAGDDPGEDALLGHDAVAGLIVDGAAGMALLADLGHLQDGFPHPQAAPHG